MPMPPAATRSRSAWSAAEDAAAAPPKTSARPRARATTSSSTPWATSSKTTSRTAANTSAINEHCKEKFDVTDDRCFVGFDAYQKVIDCCDLVMLATPPGFRPQHIEATIKAGKHLFAEKPVAVDGTGIRKVLAAYEEANKKGLSVVTGTQRRHQAGYLESMKRIHDGAIGDLVRPGSTGTRATSGPTSASPAGATPSTRSATGITSSGSAATTSSNSTSITSTWPAGP